LPLFSRFQECLCVTEHILLTPVKRKLLESIKPARKTIINDIAVGDRGQTPSSISLKQKTAEARRWWLTPVILATQEGEIRRIKVQSHPRQVVPRDPTLKTPSQKRTGGVAEGVDSEFKLQYCN
jgi:hypothetical protein